MLRAKQKRLHKKTKANKAEIMRRKYEKQTEIKNYIIEKIEKVEINEFTRRK